MTMDEELLRIWREILERPNGAMALRFYLQPTVAALLALRDGRRDALDGKPFYLWAVFTDPTHRQMLLRDGWHSLRKVFLIALALDTVYQLVVLRGLRPIQGLLVAATLALVPYILIRGPFNRILQRIRRNRGNRRPGPAGPAPAG
jgi:MFS family permease